MPFWLMLGGGVLMGLGATVEFVHYAKTNNKRALASGCLLLAACVFQIVGVLMTAGIILGNAK